MNFILGNTSINETSRIIFITELDYLCYLCPEPTCFRKSVLGIYLFEIKRVRRITSFGGNELATVLIAVVCIALLIWVTLYDRKNIKLN